jgi:hypothetical protein
LLKNKLFGEEGKPVLEVRDDSVSSSPGSITINVVSKRTRLLRNVRLSFSLVK